MNKLGIFTVIFLIIFSSCSGGKMASTWTDESYEVEHFDKILVVGNSPNVSVRYAFEKELKTTPKPMKSLGPIRRLIYICQDDPLT